MSYENKAGKITVADASDDASGTSYELLRVTTGRVFVSSVVCQPLGDNAAAVFRVFINRALPTNLGANNAMRGGVAMPVTSSTGPTTYEAAGTVTINDYLHAGERLLCTITATPTDGFDAHAVVGEHYRDFNV